VELTVEHAHKNCTFAYFASVIFRHRSKRIAFLESVNFSTCIYMQFSWWSRDHFLAPFRCVQYLPNAWSQTPQTSKRHTFRVSAFHRCHWFGVQLFPVGCAQVNRRVPKNAKKCCFLDLAPPTLQNYGIFHDSTCLHLHFDSLPSKSRRSVVSV